MKKIGASLIAIIISILVSLLLKNIIPTPDSYANADRFIKIDDQGTYYVVYDIETKVEYVVSNGQYNRGAFTLLVDKDGKPLIYGEE